MATKMGKVLCTKVPESQTSAIKMQRVFRWDEGTSRLQPTSTEPTDSLWKMRLGVPYNTATTEVVVWQRETPSPRVTPRSQAPKRNPRRRNDDSFQSPWVEYARAPRGAGFFHNCPSLRNPVEKATKSGNQGPPFREKRATFGPSPLSPGLFVSAALEVT